DGAPGEAPAGEILVGVARAPGAQPHPRFDVLLSYEAEAPRPWVGGGVDAALESLTQACARNPIAAPTAAQVLRASEGLDFETALVVESLAYSALLGGAEFRTWRAGRPVRKPPSEGP